MCIFHKWSKWEQYTVEGISYGFIWNPKKEGTPYTEKRQKRYCEKCNKVEDERI